MFAALSSLSLAIRLALKVRSHHLQRHGSFRAKVVFCEDLLQYLRPIVCPSRRVRDPPGRIGELRFQLFEPPSKVRHFVLSLIAWFSFPPARFGGLGAALQLSDPRIDVFNLNCFRGVTEDGLGRTYLDGRRGCRIN